jgi:prolyl 4-hydroxylase
MSKWKHHSGPPSPLRAKFGKTGVERLEAHPGAKRAKVEGADIFYIPEFLTKQECRTLITNIDASCRRSTLLTDSPDPEFRTSDSSDLDRWDPKIRAIDERVAHLLGIPLEHGETLQGQRYKPGQQFRAHHDYFHEDQSYWARMLAEGGQRTWTAMIFLNEVEAGGATWFPQAGIRMKPKPGLLLAWNNMRPDGSANPNTLHEGMAVVAGTKYIVTKWFREGPWLR